MRLGLALWWALVTVGVVGRARAPPPHDTPPLDTPLQDTSTPLQDTSTLDTPLQDTSTPLQDTSTPLQDTSTPLQDTSTPLQDTSTLDTPLQDTSTPLQNTSTPLQDTSTLDTPLQDTSTPLQDTSTLDTPLQDTSTPLQDTSTPLQDTSTMETPLQDTSTPLQDTSILDTPLQDTSTLDTPLQDTSTLDTPLQDTSTLDTPLQDTSTPLQDTSTPLQDTSTLDTPLQDTSTLDTPLQDTSTPLQDTSTLGTPLQDTSTLDTPVQDTSTPLQDMLLEESGTQEVVHAEELLEKYGYLECVPPGSESNTHLHRLLLYRAQRYLDTPRYDPLDFRLTDTDMYEVPPERYQYNTAGGHVEGVLGEEPVPQEDLDVPSARQDLLAALGTSRRSSTPSERQDTRPTVAVWDPVTSQLQHLPLCTQTEIQEAVKKFQAVYQVGVGGALDPPTMGLLSSPRCGNPDTIMEEPSTDQAPVKQRRQRRNAVSRAVSREKNNQGETDGKYKNSNDNEITPRDPLDDPTASVISGVQDKESLIKETIQETSDTFAEDGGVARSRQHSVQQYVEWEPDSSEALRRRRRWVEDMKRRIDSGEEDARLDALKPHLASRRTYLPLPQDSDDSQGHARDKRSIFNYGGQMFSESVLTWRLVTAGYSSQLGAGAQRAALALAFRMWSEVIPPIFLEESDPALDYVAISVGFGKRSHLGCVTEFDGLGGELGHTLRPAQDAQIHMDDDEHFTLDSDHGTNLLKVAVHEIGHVLGLGHVVRNYSIMYPVYEKALPNLGFELGWEDRKLVQRIYGSCMGTFSTVFDFLRWRPDGSLTYNTYFFRSNRFWMYENKYNRTRFGDPLYISPEWRGLPDDVDGYAHIWTRTKDIHLFFKGAYYYVYDPVAESVIPGYPRRIAQDFHGPPTSKRRTIPNNIDTVYFDKRDENLYFFKGMKVWGYDVSKGATGCCLPGYPRKLRDEYVAVTSRQLRRPDVVYYSYTDQTLFFIKDWQYWKMVSFDPQDKQRNNSIEGPYNVYDKWHDICDAELVDPLDNIISRR